ncbi:hypothetical protein BCR36DRAFT_584549, partial [Piromyces finnis]
MNKSLFNENIPIINTISDSESETNSLLSSGLCMSHTSSNSLFQSNLQKSRNTRSNNKNFFYNNKNESHYNMIIPSSNIDKNEKIRYKDNKNNYLKLNEEKIYNSISQFNKNKLYDNNNNNNNKNNIINEPSEIVSLSSSHSINRNSQYTCDNNNNNSYYSYTTSNSYIISETDYITESNYSESTPKFNRTTNEEKKEN